MNTVPVCDTCGASPAFGGAKRCTNCWEVERRLDEFLQSTGGRKFVAEALLHVSAVVNTAVEGDRLLERIIVDLKALKRPLDPEEPRAREIGDALCALAAALGRHTP